MYKKLAFLYVTLLIAVSAFGRVDVEEFTDNSAVQQNRPDFLIFRQHADGKVEAIVTGELSEQEFNQLVSSGEGFIEVDKNLLAELKAQSVQVGGDLDIAPAWGRYGYGVPFAYPPPMPVYPMGFTYFYFNAGPVYPCQIYIFEQPERRRLYREREYREPIYEEPAPQPAAPPPPPPPPRSRGERG